MERNAASLPWLSAGIAALLSSCLGGGGALSSAEAETAGDFRAESVNVPQGAIWELNRPIRITFNHPVDPQSVGFGSILIRPVPGSGVTAPVTGEFSLEPGSNGRVVVFQPSCPTNEENDDGALLPGGYEYELVLPTNASVGVTILRDTAGHALSRGLSRRFVTPTPPVQPLFLDTNPAPPSITSVTWPQRLNLFTDPEPAIEIRFDQSIDARASNLDTERLSILYSEEEVGAASPTFLHPVPGRLVLAENCASGGARVQFLISGILPPNRYLKLVMENTFRDISGQTNASPREEPLHATPSLADIYQDPSWNEEDEAVDEFSDHYLTSDRIDLEAALSLPPATVGDGEITASFEFPGKFVSPDQDFVLTASSSQIFTTGVTIFTDSNNWAHTVENGVLYVDDFILGASATLRARGDNPLVVFAQGSVQIDGTLDARGNDATWPTSLNSPQFPEGGGAGECGGGRGGTASLITTAETPRGENGDGPFGLFAGTGGQGGEGGFNEANVQNNEADTPHLITGGAGGATFALTDNVAVTWSDWETSQRPNGSDDFGPDHLESRHSYWPDGTNDPLDPLPRIAGGEDGMRGASVGSEQVTPGNPAPLTKHGVYGMEDEQVDLINQPGKLDQIGAFDPPWNTLDPVDPALPPAFDYGHPTRGPDPGRAGLSIFSDDGTTRNDFWGTRFNADGTVTVGELLTAWAGSGGGASGDSQEIQRLNGDPLPDFFPVVPFSNATVSPNFYRKGAGGGGGGGQVQIMAIGPVALGSSARILVNGGIGQGGESVLYSYNQVSGSGGGSGGHLILHSATRVDLSAIDVGDAATVAELPNLVPAETLQAIGGRRGWGASAQAPPLPSGLRDGNGDLMVGRGGSGGNGVIQIHVPDASTDLIWPAAAANAIRTYIHDFDPLNNPPNPDRVEEILDLFAAPRPYLCVPFFSSGSQIQSKWIDTGLAGLRQPAGGAGGPYPDWADPVLQFAGIDAEGWVEKDASGGTVPLDAVAGGAVSAVSIGVSQMTVPAASTYLAPPFLRSPALLEGYDVRPDDANPVATFEITEASYDRASDTLRLVTRLSDGAMNLAVAPGGSWSIRPKFFRVATTGQKDFLPDSAAVRVEFQGAADPADPQTVRPSSSSWTADLSSLQGARFLRYRVTFDIDRAKEGVAQSSPKPSMEYVKIPFVW